MSKYELEQYAFGARFISINEQLKSLFLGLQETLDEQGITIEHWLLGLKLAPSEHLMFYLAWQQLFSELSKELESREIEVPT